MHRGLATVFLAAASLCYGADVGDIAEGAIQSQTKDELVINTSPCSADSTPLKFQTPWRLKALGKKTCDKSKKTHDAYEVEQLAAADEAQKDAGTQPAAQPKPAKPKK
jgi:hypothetical protein